MATGVLIGTTESITVLVGSSFALMAIGDPFFVNHLNEIYVNLPFFEFIFGRLKLLGSYASY